jgi:hypothetical protein
MIAYAIEQKTEKTFALLEMLWASAGCLSTSL